MEPPNKGHFGTRNFVLYREVFFIWGLKCTGIIGIGTSRFVLYREAFFIWSVLYGHTGTRSLSFTERLFSLQRLKINIWDLKVYPL